MRQSRLIKCGVHERHKRIVPAAAPASLHMLAPNSKVPCTCYAIFIKDSLLLLLLVPCFRSSSTRVLILSGVARPHQRAPSASSGAQCAAHKSCYTRCVQHIYTVQDFTCGIYFSRSTSVVVVDAVVVVVAASHLSMLQMAIFSQAFCTNAKIKIFCTHNTHRRGSIRAACARYTVEGIRPKICWLALCGRHK